jgi:aspartate/methionine/tyrosine aminotransferase
MSIARPLDITPFHVMEILARAKAMEGEGRDVIHMEIGEPDFPTPPLVAEAAAEFILRGQVKYTPAAGLPALREAIAGHYAARYGVCVDPARIVVTPGASGGFLLAMGLLVAAGDRVVLADPGYPCYPNFVRLFQGVPCLVPVGTDSGFHLSAGLLRRHWDGGTAGAVIASPSNPTGAMISPAALGEILDFAQGQGGFVIADEIYHGLEYGERSRTALEFSPRAFVVNSFSKYFGMTGWRIGWAVVPEEFAEPAEKLAQNIFISAPAHSQVAALAAFSAENLQELERRRQEFQQRRDLLWSGLREIGFSVAAKPAGAFYVYADCGRFSPDSYGFARRLLEATGVAVAPGLDFGANCPERFLRFCYTASEPRLAEGLDRIEAFIRAMVAS